MKAEFNYRTRIYQSYVTARGQHLAPTSLAGLKPRMPYFKRIIRRHFPEDHEAEILEIGCGHGALLYALHREGYSRACGVDGSHEQVSAAMNLGIEGVRQGELMEVLLSTPDCSQDVVVAFDVIEHFTKIELIELVDEVHRVLKPRGRWIIHTPNAGGPFGSRMRHWDFTHELAFTNVSITQLLMASGFPDVACIEDRPVPHGLKSIIRAVIWQAIRFFWLFYIAVETGEIDRGAIFTQNLLVVAIRGD